MSAKSKILIVVILSVFATTAVGLHLVIHQPPIPMNAANTRQKPSLPAVVPVHSLVTNSEEAKYKTIPLESINYSLQGTDPAALVVNAFDNSKFKGKTRNVEVVYPQPNQALVTVTQTRPVGGNVEVMKYRARLSAFGRSLFVSSPPLWEIVWAGYQRQCWNSPVQNIQATSISPAC